MSDKRLEEIRKRAEAATPGPWMEHDEVPRSLVSGQSPNMSLLGLDLDRMAVVSLREDADFIAHAREDVPYLLSLIDDAKVALKRLSQCSGGCDGPLGCMCSAPVARAALAKMEGRTQ